MKRGKVVTKKELVLNHDDIDHFVSNMDLEIRGDWDSFLKVYPASHLKVYAVPRGGIPVAYLLKSYQNYTIVETPEEAHIIVDDLTDTHRTAAKYGEKPFYVLFDKEKEGWSDYHVVFPWEITAK